MGKENNYDGIQVVPVPRKDHRLAKKTSRATACHGYPQRGTIHKHPAKEIWFYQGAGDHAVTQVLSERAAGWIVLHAYQEEMASMVKTIRSRRSKADLLDLWRWEDDGGQIVEDHGSLSDQTFVRHTPIQIRRHVISLQWNERFVIEPFQSDSGILREDTTSKGKPNG
jgi:hypothetical protein